MLSGPETRKDSQSFLGWKGGSWRRSEAANCASCSGRRSAAANWTMAIAHGGVGSPLGRLRMLLSALAGLPRRAGLQDMGCVAEELDLLVLPRRLRERPWSLVCGPLGVCWLHLGEALRGMPRAGEVGRSVLRCLGLT